MLVAWVNYGAVFNVVSLCCCVRVVKVVLSWCYCGADRAVTGKVVVYGDGFVALVMWCCGDGVMASVVVVVLR